MKTVTVISDTHGNRAVFEKLETVLAESDYILHLGDTSADGEFLRKKYPEKTHVINGNCDPLKLGEDEEILEIENVKIFLCHGHKYSVKSTRHPLAEKAESLNCNVALYGHTHKAKEEIYGNFTVLNPGCGNSYSQTSYLYMVVNGDKVVYKHVAVD